MRRMSTVTLSGIILFVSACSVAPANPSSAGAGNATLFEGARLITGDEAPPIENSAFVVQAGRFTSVGRRGDVQTPERAARVDLTGKTVMPGIIEAHAHLGYWKDLKADFLVLDANPLDNIAYTRRISRVYLRGREVDRAALRTQLSGGSAAATRLPTTR